MCTAKKLSDRAAADKPVKRHSAQDGALLRIFEAEGLGVLVIGEELAVAAKVDHSAHGALGVVLGHVVFQLLAEAGGRRAVRGALVEHLANAGGERDIGEQMVAEQLFAMIDVGLDEALAGRRQLDVALLKFGEAQQLQGLAERKQFIDFEL